MGDDLPVGAYDDPFLLFPADYLLDDSICFFSKPGVDDSYSAGREFFLSSAAGLPAVKDNGDLMTFYLFVFDKQLDELLPLPVEVIMRNADEVIPVYDDR